jgi:hypothetical protein
MESNRRRRKKGDKREMKMGEGENEREVEGRKGYVSRKISNAVITKVERFESREIT